MNESRARPPRAIAMMLETPGFYYTSVPGNDTPNNVFVDLAGQAWAITFKPDDEYSWTVDAKLDIHGWNPDVIVTLNRPV